VLFPATARGTRLELWARAGRDAGAAKPSEDASGSDL
jgi:hypothetical protein